MKTIKDGKAKVCKILGKQQVNNVQYRLMKYVLMSNCDDGVLLHNVITGELVLLNKEEMKILDCLPASYKAEMTELIEHRFFVPMDYNEKDVVQKLRRILQKVLPSKGINGYTILPTTNCNARCFYCYEYNYPRVDMSETTANSLIEYMVNHKGPGHLYLSWFGGEPLLRAERIDQICEALRKREIEYFSTMISNGYLFSKEMVDRARDLWNLKTVQITLDGTEDIYNKTKAFIAAEGSPYQRVLRNIKLLLDKEIRVSIRLNLDLHNIQNLRELIDELTKKIGIHDKLDVYSHVLFRGAGFLPLGRNDATAKKLYEQQGKLNLYLEEIGMKKRQLLLPSLKERSCMADRDTSVCVYPDGNLFKCEHTGVFDSFGSIDRGIENELKIQKYKETFEMNQCESCPLYPSCMLLKECNGLEDHNQYTCSVEIESSRNAIKTVYNFMKANDKLP